MKSFTRPCDFTGRLSLYKYLGNLQTQTTSLSHFWKKISRFSRSMIDVKNLIQKDGAIWNAIQVKSCKRETLHSLVTRKWEVRHLKLIILMITTMISIFILLLLFSPSSSLLTNVSLNRICTFKCSKHSVCESSESAWFEEWMNAKCASDLDTF